jgi:hypothetical protein
MRVFASRRSVAKQNKTKLYGVIWGQCSPALQSELTGDTDFKEKSSVFDCIWVLQKIKLISAGLDKNTNVYISTFSALKSFYNCRQGKDESMETYHRRFEAATATVIMSKGNLTEHEGLTDYETKKGIGNSTVTDVEKLVEDKFLGAAFLQNADPGRFTAVPVCITLIHLNQVTLPLWLIRSYLPYEAIKNTSQRKKFKERIEHVYYKVISHGHQPRI